MKKIYFIAGLLIAVAVVLLLTAADDVSTYSTFQQAAQVKGKVKIAAELMKDKPITYDPLINADETTFYARDPEGEAHKVILLRPKPQDFELSEQVVLTGKMKDGIFVASDVLLKCPSKYKDEEIYLKEQQG